MLLGNNICHSLVFTKSLNPPKWLSRFKLPGKSGIRLYEGKESLLNWSVFSTEEHKASASVKKAKKNPSPVTWLTSLMHSSQPQTCNYWPSPDLWGQMRSEGWRFLHYNTFTFWKTARTSLSFSLIKMCICHGKMVAKFIWSLSAGKAWPNYRGINYPGVISSDFVLTRLNSSDFSGVSVCII